MDRKDEEKAIAIALVMAAATDTLGVVHDKQGRSVYVLVDDKNPRMFKPLAVMLTADEANNMEFDRADPMPATVN